MKKQRVNLLFAAAIASLCHVGQTQGDIVMNNLSGNVEYDGWDSLTSSTPGLSTTVLSTAPGFGSNEAGSGDANLLRTSGAHFPASAGLYSFGGHSTFEIADTSALSDVQTAVFSIQTWPNPDFGDGSTSAGSLNLAPTLNFNGGSQALTAGYTGVQYVGPFTFGGQSVNLHNYTFQWDLSSVGDSITSYDINWGQIVHTGVRGLQVESADVFSMSTAVTVVPEPASSALLGLGCILLIGLRRRRS